MTVEAVRVVRIEELDTLSADVLVDKTKINWGMVEVDGKVYKYNLQEHMAAVEKNSTVIAGLIAEVEKLSKDVKTFVDGVDENVVIEP